MIAPDQIRTLRDRWRERATWYKAAAPRICCEEIAAELDALLVGDTPPNQWETVEYWHAHYEAAMANWNHTLKRPKTAESAAAHKLRSKT